MIKFLFMLFGVCLVERSPPVFPPKFTQKINETFKYFIISSKTESTFYYDWQSQRYRIDRKNGQYDRYCGTVEKLQNTPCNSYVSEGKRYLHFPEKNYCCFCCDAEHGCGILKPNWMQGSQFVKEYEENGVKYEVWDKQGLQHNYVTMDQNSRRITKIDQQPNDLMEFIADTYSQEFDDNLLNVPEICLQDTCTKFSTCGALQNSTKTVEI